MQSEWESGKPETPCGKGSMFANTEQIRDIVKEIINQYQISIIADVGCGDQNWIHDVLLDSVEYTGYDIRPRYVDVVPFDVTIQILPNVYDLILCVCLINHLTPQQQAQAYAALKLSGGLLFLCSYMYGHAPPFTHIKSWEHISTDEEQAKKKILFERKWMYGLWRMNDAG